MWGKVSSIRGGNGTYVGKWVKIIAQTEHARGESFRFIQMPHMAMGFIPEAQKKSKDSAHTSNHFATLQDYGIVRTHFDLSYSTINTL
jgi:hypothetical protein